MSESVLAEADRLVDGDRQGDYGHPFDDFFSLAAMWSEYLRRRDPHNAGYALDAEDVGWMMVLLKVNRQAHKRKRDNLVDAIGYIKCVSLIQEKEQCGNE